ncbi:MAG: hypothetical protein GKR89_04165 [Candidatus Latescibacteria bacterium]|nr:hypothetical protein [Candidatus Latescibacterota bacterium]
MHLLNIGQWHRRINSALAFAGCLAFTGCAMLRHTAPSQQQDVDWWPQWDRLFQQIDHPLLRKLALYELPWHTHLTIGVEPTSNRLPTGPVMDLPPGSHRQETYTAADRPYGLFTLATAAAGTYVPRGLLRTYALPDTSTHRPVIEYRCFLYAQATAVVAAIAHQHIGLAERWLGALIDTQVDQGPNRGAFPAFVSAVTGQTEQLYLRTGTDAWCLYALAFYLQQAPEGKLTGPAQQSLALGLEYLRRHRFKKVRPGYRAFLGGVGLWKDDYKIFEDDHQVTWAATEHQIDMYFTLRLAVEVLADSPYARQLEHYHWMRTHVHRTLLDVLWIEDQGRLAQGVRPAHIDPRDALDLHSWGALFLRAAGEEEKARQTLADIEAFRVVDRGVEGMTPYLAERGYQHATGGVWSEGTLGAALAFKAMGAGQAASHLYDQNMRLLGPQGLPYLTRPNAEYEMQDWPDVASLSWALIYQQPNGFWEVD